MASVQLTPGAIEIMIREFANGNGGGGSELNPVLQVAELRAVNASNQKESSKRYRLVLSDGTHLQQGMLATQHNDLVAANKVQKSSIVQLTQFVCHIIQGRPIIIIVDLNILHETHDLIGDPEVFALNSNAKAPQPDQTNPASTNLQHGNPQSSGVGLIASSATHGAAPLLSPKMERGLETHSYNNSSFNAAGAPSPYPRPGAGPVNTGPISMGGSYGNQRGGFNGTSSEPSRAPMNPPRAPMNPSRAQQSMYQPPQPMYANRGPIAKNDAPPKIIPIAALNPFQGRWTIKARITSKSELKRYTNARGDGKVFSFDLLDSHGGEIRATCFNAVADQFYDMLEVGKVYIISKGSLKPARKDFNHLQNDHEIFLEATSLVKVCPEDDQSIPKQQFHFRPVSEVEVLDNGAIVDIIGVVTSVSPCATIMRKNNMETQKRALQLKDMSGKRVELVLWGSRCNAEGQELQSMCDSGHFPVLAVKAVKVNDFNGKSVGTLSSSQLFIEPEFPETQALREWFDREGKDTPSVSISREGTSFSKADVRKVVAQIKDEKLGTSEKPDYVTVCASISFIKTENFCYTACPLMIGERKCSKKVVNNGDGKWHCERCDQSVDECEYRYILQCRIVDHSGETWVTAFQETGEQILGIPAKELYYLKYEEQDDEKFSQIIRERACFNKYMLRLKVKEDTYGDEHRVRSHVVKADQINHTSEAKALFDLITQLKADDSSSNSPLKSENIPGAHAGASSLSFGSNSGFKETEGYGSSARNAGTFTNQYNGPNYGGGNSGTYSTCSSCGGTGHTTVNCPSIMSEPQYPSSFPSRMSSVPTGGGGGGGVTGECYKCHQPGHWARDCPGLSSVPPAHGPGSVNSGRYLGYQQQHLGGY